MVATATIDAFTAGHENLASTADAADVGEFERRIVQGIAKRAILDFVARVTTAIQSRTSAAKVSVDIPALGATASCTVAVSLSDHSVEIVCCCNAGLPNAPETWMHRCGA